MCMLLLLLLLLVTQHKHLYMLNSVWTNKINKTKVFKKLESQENKILELIQNLKK